MLTQSLGLSPWTQITFANFLRIALFTLYTSSDKRAYLWPLFQKNLPWKGRSLSISLLFHTSSTVMRSRDLSPQWAPKKMDYRRLRQMHDFQKLKFSLCLHLSCDEGFLLLLKLSSQLPRLGQRLAGIHYAVWLLKRKIFHFSSWSELFRNQPQSFLRQASPRSWPATSPTASVLLQRQPKKW